MRKKVTFTRGLAPARGHFTRNGLDQQGKSHQHLVNTPLWDLFKQSDQQQRSKSGPVPSPFLPRHFNVKCWDKELRRSIL